jgi:RNA polymerase sigma-70 factor, ECF subfamily
MINNPNPRIFPADPASEAALVIAARNGNEQAFEILVVRYRQRVFGHALRYTQIPEDAEDVVQETFQNAFIYLHKFEGKSSFSTWLTRIAINEALMLLRRRRSRREVPIEDSDKDVGSAEALEIPDPSPDPEANYLQREGERILSTAMAELAPRVRTAIELRGLGELTARETAQHMSLSPGAVKARVFHGRRKLRRILQRFEITPKTIQRLTVSSVANRT